MTSNSNFETKSISISIFDASQDIKIVSIFLSRVPTIKVMAAWRQNLVAAPHLFSLIAFRFLKRRTTKLLVHLPLFYSCFAETNDQTSYFNQLKAFRKCQSAMNLPENFIKSGTAVPNRIM